MKTHAIKISFALIITLVVIIITAGVQRHLTADISTRPTFNTIKMESVSENMNNLLWPAYGQAAIAHSELGILESHGNKDPQPTASTAKALWHSKTAMRYSNLLRLS